MLSRRYECVETDGRAGCSKAGVARLARWALQPSLPDGDRLRVICSVLRTLSTAPEYLYTSVVSISETLNPFKNTRGKWVIASRAQAPYLNLKDTTK